MKHFNLLGRILSSICLVVASLALTFIGCTEVDDSLGSEFIPDNQQMKIGFRSLKPCIATSLYRTDSIRTSNIENGLLGSTHSDTFGLRTAGFFTQYTWGYCPDSTAGFGYRPIFDSLLMGIAVTDHAGDTTLVKRYNVYEVIDDSFLRESEDTLFYGFFDPNPYLKRSPLFTFDFPNQAKGIYTTSTSVKLEPTAAGMDLVRRLMLLEEPYVDNDMSGFFDAEEWVSHFKGLYICPAEDAASQSESAIYNFDLLQMGLILCGRNRDKEDPTLIQDTTTSLYYFYDESAVAGNNSINTIRHDYTRSLFADKQFNEREGVFSPTTTCYVEGLAGIVTRLTFEASLFEQMEEILSEELDEYGNPYSSLALNQAALRIYDQEGDYNWEAINPSEEMILRMESAMPRLGLYTDYKDMIGISDYAYAYEASGTTLNYGGYLNRSRGCYEMYITVYLQSLWNKYISIKEEILTEEPELSGEALKTKIFEEFDAEQRTIYLAPEAYSFNSFKTSTTQGMEDGLNNAPIKLDLSYTLIK